MSTPAVPVETSEEDLERCARGKHVSEMSRTPGLTICIHCRTVDSAPTCQFYVSPEQPSCGRQSVALVTVTGRAVKAQVFLCSGHKQEHDVIFAQKRNKTKP